MTPGLGRLSGADRMHVGRGAAGVDDDERPQALTPFDAIGKNAGAFEHGRRCRHQHVIDACARAIDALRRHDPAHEHVAYRGARGLDVERVERGEDVGGGHDETPALRQHRDDLVGHFAIAGDDDRAPDRASRQRLRVVQDYVAVAAVRAAAQQHDVRRKCFHLAHVRGGQAVREAAAELGAGAERRLPRRLGGKLAHEADRHHPQPARGAARCQSIRERRQAAERIAEAGERFVETEIDVGGDRRRTLRSRHQGARIEIERTQLRPRAAEIDQQRRS